MRLGLWTALSRLWIRLVMNTVLPERLSPVTASSTVEPCAMSARLAASDSQPDALATIRGHTSWRWSSGTVSQGPAAPILALARQMEVRFRTIRAKIAEFMQNLRGCGKNLA